MQTMRKKFIVQIAKIDIYINNEIINQIIDENIKCKASKSLVRQWQYAAVASI